MLEHLRTYFELRKLRTDDSKIAKSYERDRLAAKAEKKGQVELNKLAEDERFERSIYWDQISKLQSERLCQLAIRFGVPISTDADCWEEARAVGGRYLNDKAYSELRSAVRKERNERWAYWELRVKVIVGLATALTGVAGAMIGLAAILGVKITD